jgi:hypothetical protein
MAGDWLKVEKSTPEKPEIYAIADALGIDPEIVFAKCFRLWAWADSHTTDGNQNGNALVTLMYVDRNAGVTGFAAAMVAVGWLELVPESGKDRVRFPKFDRHMGQSAKARALTSERVASHRLRKCNADDVTKTLPEKRREEKKNTNTPLPPFEGIPLPIELDTPDFLAAWKTWEDHQKAKGKKLPKTTVKAQFDDLKKFGAKKAVASIAQSIKHNWQGLFEPREGNNGTPPKPETALEKIQRKRREKECQENNSTGSTNGQPIPLPFSDSEERPPSKP